VCVPDDDPTVGKRSCVSGSVPLFANGVGELDAAGSLAVFDAGGRPGVCVWVFYLMLGFPVVIALLSLSLSLCVFFFSSY
jgi:hypothetical protein